jgi:hypothetical protein
VGALPDVGDARVDLGGSAVGSVAAAAGFAADESAVDEQGPGPVGGGFADTVLLGDLEGGGQPLTVLMPLAGRESLGDRVGDLSVGQWQGLASAAVSVAAAGSGRWAVGFGIRRGFALCARRWAGYPSESRAARAPCRERACAAGMGYQWRWPSSVISSATRGWCSSSGGQ